MSVVGLTATVGSARATTTAAGCPVNRGVVTCTFDYTGDEQTWTVPDDAVTAAPVRIVATGQSGEIGGNGTATALGGPGAVVTASFALAAGDTLAIVVPGLGNGKSVGWGGARTDLGSREVAGAGGGAAQVTSGGASGRVLEAAGGGGGGGMGGLSPLGVFVPGGSGGGGGQLGAAGGAGAGAPYQSNLDATGGLGGAGGTTSPSGGAGGVGGIPKLSPETCYAESTGATGASGGIPEAHNGGSAAQSRPDQTGDLGGAGGGGWGGGGAGGQGGFKECMLHSWAGGGGGGGGSSHVDDSAVAGSASSSLSNRTFAQNGQVQITYRIGPTATLTPHAYVTQGLDAGGMLDHVDVAVSQNVVGLTASDFRMTRNGRPVDLSATRVTGTGQTFTLSGLVSPTAPEGAYVLTLLADSGAVDPGGDPLAVDASISFTVDHARPTVTFTPIATPRETSVDEVGFTLSEPFPGGFFDFPAYTLTRDGKTVTVPFAQASATGDRKTFRVSNLAAATAAQGTYVFTVPASAVSDAAGNHLAADASITWYMDARPAGSWDSVPTPSRTGIDTATLRFSEPVTGVDLSDVQLFRDGLKVNLAGASISGSGAVYTVGGLGPLTSTLSTATGYELVLGSTTGIIDQTGHALSNQPSLDFEVTDQALTAAFDPVTPAARTTAVDQVGLHFSRPVQNLSKFDFLLTRNGQDVGLLTVTGSGADYTVEGLAPLTTAEGVYQLTLFGGKGDIYAGELPYSGSTSVSFTVDRTKPKISEVSPVSTSFLLVGKTDRLHFACADNDNGSGMASCTSTLGPDGVLIPTDEPGWMTVTFDMYDKAGNHGTHQEFYYVNPRWVSLGVYLAATPDPVLAGGNLTYTATVINQGPADATGVQLVADLPPGASFVSAPAGCEQSFRVSPPGLVVTCDVGPLATWAQETREIVVKAPGVGSITASATVSSDLEDPWPADNTVSLDSMVQPPGADLKVGLAATPDPALAGGNLTYTARVSNDGPEDATGVQLVADLPAGASFVSAPAGCEPSARVSPPGLVVTCDVGPLANGAQVTRQVVVTAPGVGPNTASASVSGDQVDRDPSDNTASVQSVVRPPWADLKVGLAATPDPVLAGGNLTYTATVTNHGPEDATGVQLVVDIPTGMPFVSAPAGCEPSARVSPPGLVVTCDVGAIASSAQATRQIILKAAATGPITASASVSGDQVDPDSSNNTVSEDSVVTAVSDVSVTLDGPGQAEAGSLQTWTATVRNDGPSTATRVILTGTLPTVLWASATDGCTQTPDVGSVTCAIGDLAPGASTSVQVQGNPSMAGPLTVAVQVQAGDTDSAKANNSSSAMTNVTPSQITCGGLPVTIVGTPRNDTINGTSGPDVIAGLDGNDHIFGGDADDVICGGEGNDMINGDDGDDAIYGQSGMDILQGWTGDDQLNGGPDFDGCYGGVGTNTAAGCETAVDATVQLGRHVIRPPGTTQQSGVLGTTGTGKGPAGESTVGSGLLPGRTTSVPAG
jgi:uncharacterized repeat protein (TIGR01451 family)